MGVPCLPCPGEQKAPRGRFSGPVHLGLHLAVTPVLDEFGLDVNDNIIGIIRAFEHGGMILLPEGFLDVRCVKYTRSPCDLHIPLEKSPESPPRMVWQWGSAWSWATFRECLNAVK